MRDKNKDCGSCSYKEVSAFIKSFTGSHKSIDDGTKIVEDLGVNGDDLSELLEKYAKTFDVDMTKYLWYFHGKEEPSLNVGAIFFRPPHKRVERIPITVGMLKSFASTKKWAVEYPPHHMPALRIDIFITWVFYLFVFLFFIGSIIAKGG